jgi:diguanylate cyclase (GGDEF)-like protein
MTKTISTLLLAWLLSWQPAVFAAPTLNFTTLRNTGMSGSGYAMIQDHQGFIWMSGKAPGVYRYDGYQFKLFGLANAADRLSHGSVTAMYEDRNNRLWLGTIDGLALFDPKTGGFKHYLPPLEHDDAGQHLQIRKIMSDGSAGLWLATRQGLQHFDPDSGRYRIYRHDPLQADSLARDNVDTLALDQQGGLWLATWPGGLDYLPKGSSEFQHYQINSQDPIENNVRALFVDSQQRLWIGSEAGILLLSSGSDWTQKRALPVPGFHEGFRVFSFYQDRSGAIWAATNIGLLRWDETRQHFDHHQHELENPGSLPSNIVSSVLEDRSGGFWASTDAGISQADLTADGLERLIPRTFDGVIDSVQNVNTALAPAAEGLLWLGSESNLLLVDPVKRRIIKNMSIKQKGIPNGRIHCLYQQPNGPLYLGTRNGLFSFDIRQQRFQALNINDMVSHHINVIVPGISGSLWLGTGGGLLEYDPKSGSLRKFQHDPLDPQSLANNSVIALLADRTGKVWMGGYTSGGGLDVLDTGTGHVQHYQFDPGNSASLASNFVNSIVEDVQGRVWVATTTGLSLAMAAADGQLSFQNFDQHHGLNSTHITAVNIDKTGQLWLSTDAGLSRFDPETERYSNYHFNLDNIVGLDDNLSARDSNGALYFLGIHGLLAVQTEHVNETQIPPVVAITDISILNHSLADNFTIDGVKLEGSIAEPKALTLPWTQSVFFSLQFSALHFADPGRNHYAYKLEGFDQDWVQTDSMNRVATYTNLNPGHYLFRVKASNNTGLWNETGISLPITITPPYWQTWWFRTLAGGSLVGLLILGYLWRVRQLLHAQAELEIQVAKRTEELTQSTVELTAMTEQALAAAKSKGAFLANMSHEIRTPMNAIMGMVHLTLLTDLTLKQRNYLDKINTSAQWLLGILNDILDFSKLEAGRLQLEHTEFRLESVMQYLEDVSSSLLVDKVLTLSFEVDSDVPTALIGDPLRLGQVLLNLLANAIKFTKSGSIIVRAQLLSFDIDQAYLRFCVTDTGIGLSDVQQSQLFNAFTQADNSTTRLYGGTGLGLAICKDLVAAMGGAIGVESHLGLGSSFYFTVKLGVGTQIESKSELLLLPIPCSDKYPALRNAYVLLVEDNLINQEFMPEILNHEGIRVDLASNGEEALVMIDINDYTAVLMDCQMPVMDGFDTTMRIRSNPRFADLPIIAMTGNVMTQDIERCLASGMNDHIGKPVDWELFFPMLERWISPQLMVDRIEAEAEATEASPGFPRLTEASLGLLITEINHLEPLSVEVLALEQLLADMSTQLANASFINDELLMQLSRLLPEAHRTKHRALVRHMLANEYPEAQAILNTLIQLSSVNPVIGPQDQRPIVLVVDDMRVNQEILVSLLSQDYRVKVARNGQRAITIAKGFPPPDLVLLDINMPGMDGYEVCQLLQDDPQTRDIPIIFVTASSDLRSETHGLQLGAVDYITKPIVPCITLLRVRNQVLSKQHEKQLRHIAHYDNLTSIANRVLLADRMKQAIAQTKRERKMLAVCYLDLDGFKFINDTMGHQAGDQVLIETAQRIGRMLRESDTVARLGGDEFVVLLPNLHHQQECITTLNRLLETIALPIYIQDQACLVTASIGVSIFPDDDSEQDLLLRHADQAMYIAKQSGKNRYHLFDLMHDQQTRAYHETILRIQQGLDDQEFELYYQPVINLSTRQPVGAEALLRWHHPERGLLLPGDFLNDIRNTELEISLGEWVIDTALAQLAQWQEAGFVLDVSVNIAAFHLQSQGFVDYFKRSFDRYPSLSQGCLHMELLETATLDDFFGVVSVTMEACRQLGVQFTLDGFGTGYSSLTYLHRLPVDTLKIDQSFARDMLENKGDKSMVQGIIVLAKAYGLKTVAEGIETMEQIDALLAMGCKYGQGYIIAQPMPASVFVATHRKLLADELTFKSFSAG